MADSRFHKNSGPKTLGELVEIADARCAPEHHDFLVSDVASLDEASETDISFLDNVKYKSAFANTKAGVCIVSPEMAEFAPETCRLLISNSPYKSYAYIAQAFYPVHEELKETQISDGAHVHPSAKIGEGCIIEAGAVIGENVEIGAHCRIDANATVTHAIIGSHTRLYPGARIGQDGFGFAIDPKGHVKVPQLGCVIIGDHVEIGANSCIDRGSGPDTIIGDGTWIDNLVQIGHNVKIGKGCVIVAQAGIAGSTELGDYVVVAAQVGIAGHLKIGTGVRIAAQSGVMRDVEAGAEVMGSPALPAKQCLRQMAILKKMSQKN
ncbi:MAG: UDP-3-O-(3-hydroxymyristoyl)glucosamine N-acyltransferase [Alphaproteobacteria bacterium]|nr:UDP-3-O-(3-hydroxymyristoyl)glucosamine N-acyltransferase [Alphaproteobacteria bacterium]